MLIEKKEKDYLFSSLRSSSISGSNLESFKLYLNNISSASFCVTFVQAIMLLTATSWLRSFIWNSKGIVLNGYCPLSPFRLGSISITRLPSSLSGIRSSATSLKNLAKA